MNAPQTQPISLGKRYILVVQNDWTKEQIVNAVEIPWDMEDLFEFTSQGTKVKPTDQSKILQWHLAWRALVPWVMLKRLFRLKRWIWHEKILVSKFTWQAEPWNILQTTNEWIFIWEKQIYALNILEDFDELENHFFDLLLVEVCWENSVNQRKSHINQYLLQEWDFRFASWARTISWPREICVWTNIIWHFNVPQNIQFLNTDWTVIEDLYEEFAAQIACLWAGRYFKPSDEKGKMITFKEGKHRLWETRLKPWDTFKVKAMVTALDKRLIEIIYIWSNQDNQEIIRWKITGTIIPKATFERWKRIGNL